MLVYTPFPSVHPPSPSIRPSIHPSPLSLTHPLTPSLTPSLPPSLPLMPYRCPNKHAARPRSQLLQYSKSIHSPAHSSPVIPATQRWTSVACAYIDGTVERERVVLPKQAMQTRTNCHLPGLIIYFIFILLSRGCVRIFLPRPASCKVTTPYIRAHILPTIFRSFVVRSFVILSPASKPLESTFSIVEPTHSRVDSFELPCAAWRANRGREPSACRLTD